MKVLCLIGTPRKGGNSEILAHRAMAGSEEMGAVIEKFYLRDMTLNPCKGCLRCNVLGHCSIKNDDFNNFRDAFSESSSVIISSPVYYHYIPGQLKVLLDRFRSTVNVRITPYELIHTRYKEQNKTFFFILTQGNPEIDDSIPALEALKLWAEMSSREPRILPPLIATFLALAGQITASEDKLKEVFKKMQLPDSLVRDKFNLYRKWLNDSYEAGKLLVKSES